MIRFDFDHHVCTECLLARRAHAVRQVAVDYEGKAAFKLACTGCGDEDGPFLGEPSPICLEALKPPDTADYRCPVGHTIPERRFDPAVGCIVLSCDHRRRRPRRPDRLDEEAAAERAARVIPEMERLSLAFGGPSCAPIACWPAEIGVDDDCELVATPLPMEAEAPPERDGSSRAALRKIVDRVERLIEERKAINEDIADVLAFGKIIGFYPPAIRAVIAMRAKDDGTRIEVEALISSYRNVLGVEGPLYQAPMPPATLEPGAPPKKLSAREKRLREALALADASRPPARPIMGLLR